MFNWMVIDISFLWIRGFDYFNLCGLFWHIIANVGEVTVISLDNLQTFESDSRFSEEELVDFVSRDFSFTICSLLNFC